jgi:hypothetical protein
VVGCRVEQTDLPIAVLLDRGEGELSAVGEVVRTDPPDAALIGCRGEGESPVVSDVVQRRIRMVGGAVDAVVRELVPLPADAVEVSVIPSLAPSLKLMRST